MMGFRQQHSLTLEPFIRYVPEVEGCHMYQATAVGEQLPIGFDGKLVGLER